VDALSQVFHTYGLEIGQPSQEQALEENDGLARVVCGAVGVG
jgi:hypothetical protein